MFKSSDDLSAKIERRIIRKIFAVFTILTVFGLAAGIGIGVLISDRKVSAGEPVVGNAPESMSSSFAEVAKRVEPAVVNIDTKGKIPDSAGRVEKPQSNIPDDILEYFKRQTRRPSYAVGSGFIVDKSGYVMTNAHVVDDASRITVRLQSGEEYTAKVIGIDEETDLAVLKVEAGRELPSVKLGDSGAAQVGDWVLAIGSPFGLAQTVTAGIISQTKRETPQSNSFQKFIQTDAAINRGNSGGPLVNMAGEVIGINSQIATSTGDYNGIGFALPSNEASSVYRQIIAAGKVRRGFLGVSLDSVKPEFAKVYQLAETRGAFITRMNDKDSPAAKAGLIVNDVIIEFNGQKIENAQDLIAKVAATEPEKQATLTYLRETGDRLEQRTTTITLGERPSANRAPDAEETPKKTGTIADAVMLPLGLTVQELTAQNANGKFDGQKGVIVKDIDPASILADVKNTDGRDALREGDLIQRINRVNITDLKSFNSAAGKLKTGDPVVLHVANYNPRTKTTQQRIVQFTVQ